MVMNPVKMHINCLRAMLANGLVELMIPVALELLDWSRVGGWGWPSLMCMGCNGDFTAKKPAHYVCTFWSDRFPFHHAIFAEACGMAYHHHYIVAGKSFCTSLEAHQGLQIPFLTVEPTFICELYQVHARLDHMLWPNDNDLHLMMLEHQLIALTD
jgi:hypothetical protein